LFPSARLASGSNAARFRLASGSPHRGSLPADMVSLSSRTSLYFWPRLTRAPASGPRPVVHAAATLATVACRCLKRLRDDGQGKQGKVIADSLAYFRRIRSGEAQTSSVATRSISVAASASTNVELHRFEPHWGSPRSSSLPSTSVQNVLRCLECGVHGEALHEQHVVLMYLIRSSGPAAARRRHV
jgi:hypothetical protein